MESESSGTNGAARSCPGRSAVLTPRSHLEVSMIISDTVVAAAGNHPALGARFRAAVATTTPGSRLPVT